MTVPVAVRRIVANLATAEVAKVQAFYADLLELKPVMDLGWVVTLAADTAAAPHLTIASEGGSGAPVPDLSIEVDDADRVYRRAVTAGIEIAYDIVDEPWGVRRFFVRDPTGRLVNILSHSR